MAAGPTTREKRRRWSPSSGPANRAAGLQAATSSAGPGCQFSRAHARRAAPRSRRPDHARTGPWRSPEAQTPLRRTRTPTRRPPRSEAGADQGSGRAWAAGRSDRAAASMSGSKAHDSTAIDDARSRRRVSSMGHTRSPSPLVLERSHVGSPWLVSGAQMSALDVRDRLRARGGAEHPARRRLPGLPAPSALSSPAM